MSSISKFCTDWSLAIIVGIYWPDNVFCRVLSKFGSGSCDTYYYIYIYWPAERSNILSFDYFNFRIFYLVGARPCVFCYSILSRLRVQYSIFQPVTIYIYIRIYKWITNMYIHNNITICIYIIICMYIHNVSW